MTQDNVLGIHTFVSGRGISSLHARSSRADAAYVDAVRLVLYLVIYFSYLLRIRILIYVLL